MSTVISKDERTMRFMFMQLVGGFAIIDLDSKAAALDWALRYVDVLGEVELDILQLQG